MQDNQSNILENFSPEAFKRARLLMINSVLSTDMQKHFQELGKFKSRTSASDFNCETNSGDRDLTLNTLFHYADISNSTKSFEVC